MQNFVKAYRAKFNREPDAIAALAYDAVKVLADAMTRANSTEGPKLRDALADGRRARRHRPPQDEREARTSTSRPSIQEVTFANGEVKFVYKTTINPN